MELKDFLVTPLVVLVILILAYLIRDKVSDHNTRKYFFPGLILKILGAIFLGLIYQFYYQGGDTFAFHTHGSKIIYEAFWNSPMKGIQLFFSDGVYHAETLNYASQIWYYGDQSSYFVIRIAAFFDLLTFGTYSATAVLFASLSFSGLWALYLCFYGYFKNAHLLLAIAIFFIPSVFLWGSGILKDTITIGFLGWAVYSANKAFIKLKFKPGFIILFIISCWVIFSVKIYILLTFMPALIIWIYLTHLKKISNKLLRYLIAPFLILLAVFSGYLAIFSIAKNDPRYALDKIAQTAKITAYDIRYWTGRDAGSGYNLGELDGTVEGMMTLIPSAVNVTLFRPYFWEVSNPLMVFSALESLITLILTLIVFAYLIRNKQRVKLTNPIIIFMLTFSIVFAFAVGISTFNFGTLARYKIPMIPFYFSALFIIMSKVNHS